MMHSLQTGVSGLKSNQTRMDVTGNNIANINTIAFKRSRTAFHEVLGQRMATGNAVNPSFMGLGVGVGSIDKDWSQGRMEFTNLATDLALTGDGFFVVANGSEQLLTRAGNFDLDANGNLVTGGGLNLQGWTFNGGNEAVTGVPSNVNINLDATSAPQATDTITIGGNLSADKAVGDTQTVSTFVYDAQGKKQSVTLTLEKATAIRDGDAEDTWTITSIETESGATITPPADAIAFDENGVMTSADTLEFDWDINGTGDATTFTLDLTDVRQVGGSTTITVREQNGYGAGELTGWTVTTEGIVELSFSNGQTENAYQLAIGTVKNAEGLQQLGKNLYGMTVDAGELVVGRAGSEVGTSVTVGALEMSNVDLATEFTDMIVNQRGYQAAARVITTSDELLQETISLKR